MRRIIFAMFTFIFCLSWAEVKVEKVLETTSIKEYNQWVKQNKVKCPKLEPILIQSSHEIRGVLRQYTIRYYNQNGEKLKEETLQDSLLSIYVPFTNDRLILRKKLQGDANEVTVKNAEGQVLFKRDDIRTHLAYTGIGVYVEGLSAECPADENTVLRIFNENGQEIGTLRGFGFINLLNICAPNDRRYCVFEGGNPYHGIPVIMLNRTGKELWRYEIDRGVISLFISKTGLHIGILHSNKGKILVFDENGNLVQEYTPFGENWYWILSAFSDDGQWLVTGFHSKVKFYNNKTGALVWEDTVTLKEKADTVKYVHSMKNGDFIIVLCNSHNIYVFDTTGKLLLVHNFRLGKHLIPRRIHGTVTEFEVLTQNWYSDVIGEYLIINKYSNGVSGARTQGDMKIIYRISEP
ncbi:hypothetical protein KAX97_04590 [candidate division WOR-3 bacterium]|nr:hypothetical protein [candidate division WOR-3 bacterium]